MIHPKWVTALLYTVYAITHTQSGWATTAVQVHLNYLQNAAAAGTVFWELVTLSQ